MQHRAALRATSRALALACLTLACGPATVRPLADDAAVRSGRDVDAPPADGVGPAAISAPVDAPAGEGRLDGSAWKCTPGAGNRLGMPCGCSEECQSGVCADGVCCNLPCNGACFSCKLPGRMGACSPVAIGAPDPHGVCTRQAPETCGRTGLCAFASCARYPPGTRCGASTCSGASVIQSYCHADGTCAAGTPINCSPSICAAGACALDCKSDADCAAPTPA